MKLLAVVLIVGCSVRFVMFDVGSLSYVDLLVDVVHDTHDALFITFSERLVFISDESNKNICEVLWMDEMSCMPTVCWLSAGVHQIIWGCGILAFSRELMCEFAGHRSPLVHRTGVSRDGGFEISKLI